MSIRLPIILFFVLSMAIEICPGQNKENPRVGYACSIIGSPSAEVKQYFALILSKNYDELAMGIWEENAAIQFLSAFSLDYLANQNIISLSENQIEQINKVKSSGKKVSWCDGCIITDKIPVRKLFEGRYRKISTGFLQDLLKRQI